MSRLCRWWSTGRARVWGGVGARRVRVATMVRRRCGCPCGCRKYIGPGATGFGYLPVAVARAMNPLAAITNALDADRVVSIQPTDEFSAASGPARRCRHCRHRHARRRSHLHRWQHHDNPRHRGPRRSTSPERRSPGDAAVSDQHTVVAVRRIVPAGQRRDQPRQLTRP